ncbi:MAG: hypothetical protein JSW51_11205 [Gemmatimonadota bacterium]|nr:MAG: hypothetical protein JSW51_11205 [Gemmatimonadota bacterium]
MSDFGADVIDLPELAGHPNSEFTRDISLCTSAGHIRLRMGVVGRSGEEEWMSQAFTSLEMPRQHIFVTLSSPLQEARPAAVPAAP